MKNYILFIILSACLAVSCKKSDGSLDVDLTKYNADNYVSDPVIDKWLTDSLNTPYNIQTVYRFERNLSDVSRNISPVDLEKVLPTMQAVRNIFLKPYEKIAGIPFIKKLTPKQFVLYGSPSYNDNGSITLGTADGGRRVVLYRLNSIDLKNGNNVREIMRTIHHEFTHIINQNVAIPPSFEFTSKADYTTDWTGSGNTADLAKELGFISQYSRSSYSEDFAEMVAHLLVEGQQWFNNYINTTNPKARAALLAKEKDVIDYFNTYFSIDFRALQMEVQTALKDLYGAKDPADVTSTLLPLMIANNRVYSITYDPSAEHYTKYGRSAAFNTLYNNYKAAIATGGRNLISIQFLFQNGTSLVFRANYSNASGNVFSADYNFNFTINTQTGLTQFTKAIPEGTGGTYNNGNVAALKTPFEQIILPYLTNRRFIAAWLPNTIAENNPLYRTFAGFYVDGTPTDYVYGPIVLK